MRNTDLKKIAGCLKDAEKKMKKYYLLTPGPTPIPPEVALESALPILHHRTTEFGTIFTQVIDGLKYVFQTEGTVLLLTSSGTGGMEASVVNLLSPGDKVLVASSGVFGDRWIKILETYGIKPETVRNEWGKAIDCEAVEKKLKANSEIKAVFTTHTETSTGVVNDLKSIGEIVAKTEAVLVIDSISGLCAQELHTDKWHLDVVVGASQKGLMSAPGLSFVALSEKAWDLVEKAELPRFYWDFRRMKKSLADKETPFTPAVTLIIGLNQAIEMIKKETLEKIWARHEKLARATRAGMQALNLELFAQNPSNVVTAVESPQGLDSGKLVKKLREEYGVSIAGGQQGLKGKIFRLAHLGYMNEFDILVGISAVERGLKELGYNNFDFGAGLSAAEKILFQM